MYKYFVNLLYCLFIIKKKKKKNKKIYINKKKPLEILEN
jgi:hypothetical protein